MNNLTQDCLSIIANYLHISDAIKISELNKEFNKIWPYIKYEHLVECNNLDIIKKNKNIKFSCYTSKIIDIPDNLHTLDSWSNNWFFNITEFDVKNLRGN